MKYDYGSERALRSETSSQTSRICSDSSKFWSFTKLTISSWQPHVLFSKTEICPFLQQPGFPFYWSAHYKFSHQLTGSNGPGYEWAGVCQYPMRLSMWLMQHTYRPLDASCRRQMSGNLRWFSAPAQLCAGQMIIKQSLLILVVEMVEVVVEE